MTKILLVQYYFIISCCIISSFFPVCGFLPSSSFHHRSGSITKVNTNPIPALYSTSETIGIESKLEKETFIRKVLIQNSLFDGIQEENLQQMVDAFERKEAKQDETIVCQGDKTEGGYVYIVKEGKCSVIVDESRVPAPFGTIGRNSLFGELGILYDETRAATIKVASRKLIYYQVNGEIFTSILDKSGEFITTLKEIDNVINQVEGTQALYGGDIIPIYKPERLWLWTQFTGTVVKINWETTLFNMVLCLGFCTYVRMETGEVPFIALPDSSNPFVERLSLVHEIWDIQKALTTFVLTFFVNQSFSFWNGVYSLARKVQNHLNNFNLLLSTNILRDDDGTCKQESKQFLEEIAQFTRLYHILLWASKAERFSVLCTPEGLLRMESRGLMTTQQLKVLQEMKLPDDSLYNAPLNWIMIRSNQAMSEGILAGDTATKGMLLKEMVFMRTAARDISNKLSGRMPLTYVQFVQILVDIFVLTTPLALYSDLGEYSVFAVGLVTLFYTGLNNLAKIFLDPLNNENFCENSIFMDLGVLIREANGISTQYIKAGKEVPF